MNLSCLTILIASTYDVCDAVARVEHYASGASRRVQRQHSLNVHVEGGHVERLEADLRHFFAVRLGVERRLRHEQRVLFGRHAQLVVERVVPNPAITAALVFLPQYFTVQVTNYEYEYNVRMQILL